MTHPPTGAGKSTFELVDTKKLFTALNLEPGNTFLDLACGSGTYTLLASEFVTDEGAVYAVDLWEEGITGLESERRERGIDHVHPRVADASKRVPVDTDAIDVCLIAAALHDFVRDGTERAVIQEVIRVLRPDARLAVVEFKKVAGPPGPPVNVRLSPAELEELLRPRGLAPLRTLDVGPYHYLSLFQPGHHDPA